MLNTQEKFISLIKELKIIAKESEIDISNINHLENVINEIKLLIPIVGDFSAGKSTLLNKFIGKDILEVNILPETSIPAELYYSDREYNIAVDKNGNEIEIDNLSKDNIQKYSYIKRYINSDNLKKIDPIILVDMPGFDSPFENHNQSIISYLDKGIYYIVFSPIDAGTISKSLITQIKNIRGFKKDFSMFITKCELRSKEDFNDVKEEMKKTLSSISYDKDIYSISSTDINLFNEVIEKLDPENIFKSIYIDSIKDLIYELKTSINIKISAFKKDKKANDKIIEELKDSLNKIEAKKAKLIEDEKNKNYESEVNSIVQEVGKELNNNIDSLVNAAMRGDSDGLKEEMLNIIQPIVIEKTNIALDNININISRQFSTDVKSLDSILSEYNIPNFIEKIESNIEKYRDKIKIPQLKSDTSNTNTAYKTVMTTAAILTNIVNPIIEILIVFLPEILNLCFGFIREKQQKDEIKSQILSQITHIKRELKVQISKVLKENASASIDSISNSFDEELNKKREEIQQAQEEISSKKDLEEVIYRLQNNLKKIDELSNFLYE